MSANSAISRTSARRSRAPLGMIDYVAERGRRRFVAQIVGKDFALSLPVRSGLAAAVQEKVRQLQLGDVWATCSDFGSICASFVKSSNFLCNPFSGVIKLETATHDFINLVASET